MLKQVTAAKGGVEGGGDKVQTVDSAKSEQVTSSSSTTTKTSSKSVVEKSSSITEAVKLFGSKILRSESSKKSSSSKQVTSDDAGKSQQASKTSKKSDKKSKNKSKVKMVGSKIIKTSTQDDDSDDNLQITEITGSDKSDFDAMSTSSAYMIDEDPSDKTIVDSSLKTSGVKESSSTSSFNVQEMHNVSQSSSQSSFQVVSDAGQKISSSTTVVGGETNTLQDKILIDSKGVNISDKTSKISSSTVLNESSSSSNFNESMSHSTVMESSSKVDSGFIDSSTLHESYAIDNTNNDKSSGQTNVRLVGSKIVHVPSSTKDINESFLNMERGKVVDGSSSIKSVSESHSSKSENVILKGKSSIDSSKIDQFDNFTDSIVTSTPKKVKDKISDVQLSSVTSTSESSSVQKSSSQSTKKISSSTSSSKFETSTKISGSKVDITELSSKGDATIDTGKSEFTSIKDGDLYDASGVRIIRVSDGDSSNSSKSQISSEVTETTTYHTSPEGVTTFVTSRITNGGKPEVVSEGTVPDSSKESRVNNSAVRSRTVKRTTVTKDGKTFVTESENIVCDGKSKDSIEVVRDSSDLYETVYNVKMVGGKLIKVPEKVRKEIKISTSSLEGHDQPLRDDNVVKSSSIEKSSQQDKTESTTSNVSGASNITFVSNLDIEKSKNIGSVSDSKLLVGQNKQLEIDISSRDGDQKIDKTQQLSSETRSSEFMSTSSHVKESSQSVSKFHTSSDQTVKQTAGRQTETVYIETVPTVETVKMVGGKIVRTIASDGTTKSVVSESSHTGKKDMKSYTDSSEYVITSSDKISSQDKVDVKEFEKNKYGMQLEKRSTHDRTKRDEDVGYQESLKIDTARSTASNTTSTTVIKTISNQSEVQSSSSDSKFITDKSDKHSIVTDKTKQVDIGDSKKIIDDKSQKEQSVRLVGGKIVKSGVDDYSYYTSKSKDKKIDSKVTSDFHIKEGTDTSDRDTSTSNITHLGKSSTLDKTTTDEQTRFIAAEKRSMEATQKSVSKISSEEYDTNVSSKELQSRGESTLTTHKHQVSKDFDSQSKNITSSDSFSSVSTSKISENVSTVKGEERLSDTQNKWQSLPAAGKPSTKRSPSPEKTTEKQPKQNEPIKSSWKNLPAAGKPSGYSEHHDYSEGFPTDKDGARENPDITNKKSNLPAAGKPTTAAKRSPSPEKTTEKQPSKPSEPSVSQWKDLPAAGKPTTTRSSSPEKPREKQPPQPDEPPKRQWKNLPAAGMPSGYSEHHDFSEGYPTDRDKPEKALPATGKPTRRSQSPEKSSKDHPQRPDEPVKSQWKNLPAAGMPSGYSEHHDFSEGYPTDRDKSDGSNKPLPAAGRRSQSPEKSSKDQPQRPDEPVKSQWKNLPAAGMPSGYSEHHDFSEGYPTDRDVRDKPDGSKKSMPAAGKPTRRSQSPEKSNKDQPQKPDEPVKSQWKNLPAAGMPSGHSEHHDYSEGYPADKDVVKDDKGATRKSPQKSAKRSPSPEKSLDGPDKKPKKSKPAAGKPSQSDKPEKVVETTKKTMDTTQEVVDDGFDIVMTDAVRMIGGKIVKTKVKTKVIKQDLNKGRRKSTESVDSSATYCVDEPMIVEFPYLDDTDHTTMTIYDNDREAGRMMQFDDTKVTTDIGNREVWEKTDNISSSKKISTSSSKTAVSKKSQSTRTTVYETRVMNERVNG
ncbi:serine-rich adhesin for platelets-like [Nilaparvata lugens]|uniref:serine-rich adhesin for platelets-like n=1 Tax=Nilaparvata lugens TaxID=108931 RepID=UPI00193C8BBB|nr:serine-rich adhesin for platelets-like [Nilaparvata lugens]